jgi:basic amino acid/polyamine antiporter, APA family
VLESSESKLVRAIGRWSLLALMLNSIVGSGIFGLPAAIAAKTGRQSPLVFLIAALGMGVIYACISEVGSRFRTTGGPYIYARVAFGRFIGIQVGWLNWLSRLASSAANVSLFGAYISALWPVLNQPAIRTLVLTGLVGLLAVANLRGVKIGVGVSNLLTAGKIGTLVSLVIVGLAYLLAHGRVAQPVHESYPLGTWLNSVLLVVFAYGGFENGLTPAGETSNPERDTPFAMLAALALCVPLYSAIQFVVVNVLANPSASERPLATVAHVVGGEVFSTAVAAGALLAVIGYLSAAMIACPRITLAFAEQQDFPRWFAAIHSRYKTPYVSILVYAALIWILGLSGSFIVNARLSAVPRLIIYALSCASLPVLRRKLPKAGKFRLPLGVVFPILGVIFCIAVLSRATKPEFLIAAIVIALAALNWVAVRLAKGEQFAKRSGST